MIPHKEPRREEHRETRKEEKERDELTPEHLKFLRRASKKSHKRENGVITLIAGSKEWHGAPILAGLTASFFVDLILVLTPKENVLTIKKKSPVFIVGELNLKNLIKAIKKSDALLIGPGLEVSQKNKKSISFILKEFPNLKTVLDASALRLITPSQLHSNCLITPHANEFESLFKLPPSKTNIKNSAQQFGGVILFKSQIDLISDGNKVYTNSTGNEGMTKGGTGDVLAGLCAGFAAKNPLLLSAQAAAFLNGFAGDELYKKRFTAYNAQDLLEMIPFAFKKLTK